MIDSFLPCECNKTTLMKGMHGHNYLVERFMRTMSRILYNKAYTAEQMWSHGYTSQ